ncbi:MAG: hypothetical protein JFR41_06515 [Muribaculaceae bacterium]|nr:hypothetical protein [Muribaculaceae bacterium]
MKKTLVLLSAAGLLAMSACSNDGAAGFNGDIQQIPSTDEIQMLDQDESDAMARMEDFSSVLFNTAAEHYQEVFTDGDGNMLMSPLSAAMALAMKANSCDDATAGKIARLVGYDNIDAVNSAYSKIIPNLCLKNSGATMSIANSVWYNSGFSINPEFASDINKNYYGEVTGLDFSASEAKDIIRSWCAMKTGNLINDMAPNVNRETLVLLANAFYFSANWDSAFDKCLTVDRDFAGTKKTVSVPMMHKDMRECLNYSETDRARIVTLPFQGAHTMTLVLPKDGISSDELSRGISFSALKEEATPVFANLHIDLPRFTATADIDLMTVLSHLGIPQLSMLSNMGIERISQTEILHKTSISTDEDGIEMGAATVVKEDNILPGPQEHPDPEEINITFDRPFIFFITDHNSGLTLMAGRICNL